MTAAARQHAASGNYLFFDVGEYRFCAPVDDVEAIVELNGVHRLPVAPKGVAGTFMFRDQLAVVCDLGSVLNVDADAARKDLSVVVRLPIGLVAFRVDHVSDIVAASEVRPQKADERAMKEWMDGYVMQGPHIAVLTTFDKLLALFGVSGVAKLSIAADPAQPPQQQPAQASVEPVAPRGTAGQPVEANRRAKAAAEGRGEAVARAAAVSHVELAAPATPEIVAGDAEPIAHDEPAAAVESVTEAGGAGELSLEEAERAEQAEFEAIDRVIGAEVESPRVDFEALSDAGSAPEIAAGATDSAASAGEFVEPQELVTRPGQLDEDAPSEAPAHIDAACPPAPVEPISEDASVPESIGFDAEPPAQSAAPLDSVAAVEPALDSDEWRETRWGEKPLDSLEEMPAAEAQASPPLEETPAAEGQAPSSQEPQLDAGDEVESLEAAHGAAPLAQFDDAATRDMRDPESWAEFEHAPSPGGRVEAKDAALRGSTDWANDSGDHPGELEPEPEPEPMIAAGYRSLSAPSAVRSGRGGRSYAALAVAVVVLLAAIAGAWWWLGSPPPQQNADAPRPAEAAASRPIASGPIEKPTTDKLDIVGKDFELRVEAAAPAQGNSPRPAPAPSSRNETVHVVVKGDTLWDIASQTLGNPYRYPELARSSAIRNPDLIHPGDVVRIRKRR